MLGGVGVGCKAEGTTLERFATPKFLQDEFSDDPQLTPIQSR